MTNKEYEEAMKAERDAHLEAVKTVMENRKNGRLVGLGENLPEGYKDGCPIEVNYTGGLSRPDNGLKMPDHTEVAMQMADAILGYDEKQQNEMLYHLYGRVRAKRMLEITNTKEKLDALQKLFEQLPSITNG